MHGLLGGAARRPGPATPPGGRRWAGRAVEPAVGQPAGDAGQHRPGWSAGRRRARPARRPLGHRVERGQQPRHAAARRCRPRPGRPPRPGRSPPARARRARPAVTAYARAITSWTVVRRGPAEQPLEQRLGQRGRRAATVEIGHHRDQRLARQPHRRADVAEQPARAVRLPHDLPVDHRRRTRAGARRRAPRRTARGVPAANAVDQVGDDLDLPGQPEPAPGLARVLPATSMPGRTGPGDAEHPRPDGGRGRARRAPQRPPAPAGPRGRPRWSAG